MSRRHFTPKQDGLLAKQYAAGATYDELAERHGGTDVSVRSAVRRAGGASRRGGPKSGWSADYKQEALRLYREGQSVKAVARHFATSDDVISAVLRESGEPLHPGGRTHPRFRTVEECQVVAGQYAAGASLSALAKQFGCTTPTISAAIERGGGQRRPPGVSKIWTDDVIAWAVERYSSGQSQQSIADELGVSQGAVSTRLRAVGAIPAPNRPSGADAPGWRGGRTVSADGYVRVKPYEDDKPFVTMAGSDYVLEHRLVMGRALGRPLAPTETVHHVNGDRQDNRLENLQLRQGSHGAGVVFRCVDCGSTNVEAALLR